MTKLPNELQEQRVLDQQRAAFYFGSTITIGEAFLQINRVEQLQFYSSGDSLLTIIMIERTNERVAVAVRFGSGIMSKYDTSCTNSGWTAESTSQLCHVNHDE